MKKQTKLVVGVSGAKGSFSEEAALNYVAKSRIKSYSIQYLVSVENVLQALERGEIAEGIFPIENSNGGVVIETVYAMAKHTFHIKKMFEIDVHHNLLVKRGVTRAEIKKIVSHDQALKQCRMYLKRAWPKVKVAEYKDTALAGQGPCQRETARLNGRHRFRSSGRFI